MSAIRPSGRGLIVSTRSANHKPIVGTTAQKIEALRHNEKSLVDLIGLASEGSRLSLRRRTGLGCGLLFCAQVARRVGLPQDAQALRAAVDKFTATRTLADRELLIRRIRAITRAAVWVAENERRKHAPA